MILLLLSLAFAADDGLPPLPDPPVARPAEAEFVVEGQCPRVMKLKVGESLPGGLLDEEGKVTCNGVLLPTGRSLHASALIAWGDAQAEYATGIEIRWRGDTASLQYSLRSADMVIARLSKPPAFFDRPSTIRALADARVAGILVVTAYILIRGSDGV